MNLDIFETYIVPLAHDLKSYARCLNCLGTLTLYELFLEFMLLAFLNVDNYSSKKCVRHLIKQRDVGLVAYLHGNGIL